MKASEVISRARSISDLTNSQYIDHIDEIQSLNESYKDIYSTLMASNDDFYITETTIAILSTMKTAGTENEYIVPLPADFYKLRYLDYQNSGGTKWEPIKKFSLGMKDYTPSEPYYRIKNNTLWIIASTYNNVLPSIKIGYYPPPETITLPEPDFQYATAVAPNAFSGITFPGWMETAAGVDYGFYITGGQSIISGSIKNGSVGSPVTLLGTAVARSNLVYYKGYLYWLQAADIYRAPTDMVTTPLVPAQVTSTADVTSFAIYNDLIYYSPGATIKTCTLAGASITSIYTASAGSWMCVCQGTVYFIDTSNNLKYIVNATTSTTLLANVTAATSDQTYIYALKTTYNLDRLTISTLVITATDTLREDVSTIGPWYSGRIPLLTKEGQSYFAISDEVDYDFDYPENLVPEIMAFQCAVDFKAKKLGDTTQLKERLAALWIRFCGQPGPKGEVVGRDDYRRERISNEYDHAAWGIH